MLAVQRDPEPGGAAGVEPLDCLRCNPHSIALCRIAHRKPHNSVAYALIRPSSSIHEVP